MSKDKKNTQTTFPAIAKTLAVIAVIIIATYSIMAVITHFSLNFETENYKFTDSLLSVFNTETAIFKFFTIFMIMNVAWLSIALLVYFIKKMIIKRT